MDNAKFGDILKKFGEQYIKDIVQFLINNDKVVTAKLRNSLAYQLRDDSTIDFLAEKYIYNIEKGRRKGTYPPIAPLLQWAKIRGLSENTAYGVRQNIFKFGIAPTPFIMQVLDKTLINYRPILEEGFAKLFDEELKKLNKK